MSEHEANRITILLIAIVFPIVGVCKLYLAQVMRRNTHIRTRIGDWLVRMFVAIGVTFIFVGAAYGISFSFDWLETPLWARWAIRVAGVLSSLCSLLATVILVRHLIPLLRDVEEGPP
jgi:hypothetical protein